MASRRRPEARQSTHEGSMLNGPKLLRIWLALSALWAAFVLIEFYQSSNRVPKKPVLVLLAACIPPIIALIACYASFKIWKRFGAPNWSRLAANVRRGILRLYLIIVIPWT